MARYEQIRDRLPSLYRPQIDDQGLMVGFLQAVGQALEQVDLEAAAVLQAHWFEYADLALYDGFFQRRRQLLGEPPPPPGDPSLLGFPYLDELAYLGRLLALAPWQEPNPETVEAFRLRMRRTVALYQDGLGTLSALGRMVELQLPVDFLAAPAWRDRPFWLEENVPLGTVLQPATPRGAPTDLVGPLMRWSMTQRGLTPAYPTLYIQGVVPQPNQVEATVSPLIERYGGPGRPLGIAYLGTLEADQTLRLRPAFTSWLGTDTGLRRASSATNSTAAGPWVEQEEGPTGAVVAMAQSEDAALWVAVNDGDGGGGQLWRYDGLTWQAVLDDLATIHSLLSNGQDLLIGTEAGLRLLPLFPPPGEELTPITLSSQAVYGLTVIADQIWLGTAAGAFTLATDNTLTPTEVQGFAVYAIYADPGGTRFFGTERGLIQHQPALEAWYRYRGQLRTEQQSDWQSFNPALVPSGTEDSFLPAVRAITRSRDGALWLGTDQGLARYRSEPVRGLTTETILQAFPDISTGRVFTLATDARGLLWIGCDRGLLRYDGYRLWQYQGDGWQPLGLADQLYPATRDPLPRDAWRFNPSTTAWERFTPLSFSLALRTVAATPVQSLAWTDGVIAELGQWDGSQFTAEAEAADPTPLLQMRYKPRPTEVRDGGLVAVPRLPLGTSTWRYLRVESESDQVSADRPAWTGEGRRLEEDPSNLDPESGRFDLEPPPPSDFDASLFAFLPAARVWISWQPSQPASVLVRLQRQRAGEALDPIILDRVWAGIQQVRPAGVQTQLALEDDILRGQ